MIAEWTKEHYGVSHIKNTPGKFQITKSVSDNLAHVYVLDKDSDASFTAIDEFHGTELACTLEAEKIFHNLWKRYGIDMFDPAPMTTLNKEFLVEELIYILEVSGLKPYIHCMAVSGSVYIKFKYEKLGSLRIADHKEKEKYGYRWNLRKDITEFSESKTKGHKQFFYPMSMVGDLITHMMRYHNVIYGGG